MSYEKSCGCVIFRTADELRVLIIKQSRNGNWSFPKGHVEEGETEIQTAMREVLEEVGLKIKPMEGFRETIHYNPRPNVNKDVVYFIARSKIGRVKLQKEEVADYKWVRPEQAFKILSFVNDKEVLTKALEFIEKN
jgi:8-oxo-dGTP pyrophosphatase MutT (NUDIX family)